MRGSPTDMQLPPATLPVLLATLLGTAASCRSPEGSGGAAVDAAGPAGPAAAGEELFAPWRSAETHGGAYTVEWRPRAPEVPKNEPFEIDVRLRRGGEPVPGARLRMSAWMPDHRHGMLRRPLVVDRGDGSYLVRGPLLHMAGHWQLFFDVLDAAGGKERATFDLEL